MKLIVAILRPERLNAVLETLFRAEVRGLPHPDTGPFEVYSPFSANLVVRAGAGPQLITATRHLGPRNRYHPDRTSNFNPQMDAWYRLGAALIHPNQ